MAEFTRDGITLYYEVKGDPQGKNTIAFFNGVMASTSSWAFLTPVFERLGFRVILHDFKGQLSSSKPQGPYSFAQHSAEAKALFEHLGVEKLHIVGTSYGGEVAMKFAAMYPEMAQSISVIASVSELDPVLEHSVLAWKSLCDMSGEDFFLGMLPGIYGGDYLREKREMLFEHAKLVNRFPREYFEGQKTLYDTFVQDVYMTDELRKITCPALIISGENDILKPPKFSQIIAENIPNSEYIMIPNSGHVIIFEKPRELESAISGFVLKHC